MGRMPLMIMGFVLALITIFVLQQTALFPPTNAARRLASPGAKFLVTTPTIFSHSALTLDRTRFGNLLHRSVIIKSWYLDAQAISWAKSRAGFGAESDLLEARWHVGNAEAFAAAMDEPQKARSELDRADELMQRVLPAINQDLQFIVQAIRSEIEKGKYQLDRGDSNSEALDEQIKTDLDWIIDTVHS
jgi:hypothetical protein